MTIRKVSIVIPMRNEASRIEHVLEEIAAQDWPGAVEVLVGDGRSTDDSVAILHETAARLGLDAAVVDNPGRLAASGLNVCIERATGDLVVRMDCHARYARDYVSACVRGSEETQAENVGGPTLVEGESATERAVACAMESPFGGIGWSSATTDVPVEHDTVYCGAFRPEVFDRVGLFDPTVGPNEDEEFNLRLRRAGGRVFLDPRIRIWYTPRPSLRGVVRQYYRYGFYKVAVMRKHRRVATARSLVPPAFVVSLVVLAALTPWSAAARTLLAAELLLYAVFAVAFAALALRRHREPAGLLPRVVAAFPAFHLSYGVGMLTAWLLTVLGRGPGGGHTGHPSRQAAASVADAGRADG